jgi:peroxiredoxin
MFDLNKVVIFFLLTAYSIQCHAQTVISGEVPSFTNKSVSLWGFSGTSKKILDTQVLNDHGQFTLKVSEGISFCGYLEIEGNQTGPILLDADDSLYYVEESGIQSLEIQLEHGRLNKGLHQYILAKPSKMKAISALTFLKSVYLNDSNLSSLSERVPFFEEEIIRIKAIDDQFVHSFGDDSAVQEYLQYWNLVNITPFILSQNFEKVPNQVQKFRQIDYSDRSLYESGLLKAVIESHLLLIENSAMNFDKMISEINTSLDSIVFSLEPLPRIDFSQTVLHIYRYLESRSLFPSSKYFALQLLNEHFDKLEDQLVDELEGYRKLDIGNVAPDIVFHPFVGMEGLDNQPNLDRLSETKDSLIVVFFGASWCPLCPPELMKLNRVQNQFSEHNIATFFISLDTNKKVLTNFIEPFSFPCYSDFKSWDSKIARDYHIALTPSIFVLDHELKIILKPKNIEQLIAWVNWNFSNVKTD